MIHGAASYGSAPVNGIFHTAPSIAVAKIRTRIFGFRVIFKGVFPNTAVWVRINVSAVRPRNGYAVIYRNVPDLLCRLLAPGMLIARDIPLAVGNRVIACG